VHQEIKKFPGLSASCFEPDSSAIIHLVVSKKRNVTVMRIVKNYSSVPHLSLNPTTCLTPAPMAHSTVETKAMCPQCFSVTQSRFIRILSSGKKLSIL
jgi:hypothetical protein